MYEVAKRSAAFAAATGGLLLVGVGCASADSIVQTTAGGEAPASVSATGLDAAMAKTGGVLSGNNIAAPLSVPVNLCGIAILGSIAGQSCSTGGVASGSSADAAATALGALSGNVVQAPLNIPLDISELNALSAVADTGADACSCSTGTSPANSAAQTAAGTVRSYSKQSAPMANTV